MNTYFLGAEMLDHELIILPLIVAAGFAGWMMLMLVQIVWLDEFPRGNKKLQTKHRDGNKKERDFMEAA